MGIIDNERYDVFFSYAHDDADVHKDWLPIVFAPELIMTQNRTGLNTVSRTDPSRVKTLLYFRHYFFEFI